MQLIFVLLVGSEKLSPSYRRQRTSFGISQLDKVTNYLSLICVRKDICLLCVTMNRKMKKNHEFHYVFCVG